MFSHYIWGLSSVGRAFTLQGKGQGFDSPSLHRLPLLWRSAAVRRQCLHSSVWLERVLAMYEVVGSNPTGDSSAALSVAVRIAPHFLCPITLCDAAGVYGHKGPVWRDFLRHVCYRFRTVIYVNFDGGSCYASFSFHHRSRCGCSSRAHCKSP